MKKTPVKVAVTGAAGQIGYALLFRIAAGEMFGPDQPVILHLVDIEPALPALQGVMMELEDGAFPLLRGMKAAADADAGFDGVNWALLIGSVPRKPGMERKDLLNINGRIFVAQGRAVQKSAAADVRVLVVGNPCNTNCLIAMNNAPDVPRDRWFAMTRLDENRAKSLLARKASVPVEAVTNMAVWGNHSATQYPDFYNARIQGRPVTEVIPDENWLRTEFVAAVAQRGTAVLKARGASSAASAANAVIDTVRSVIHPTAANDLDGLRHGADGARSMARGLVGTFHSVCVCSDGSYGVDQGLISSFPVKSDGKCVGIVQNLPVNPFSRGKIEASVNELKEERAIAAEAGLLS